MRIWKYGGPCCETDFTFIWRYVCVYVSVSVSVCENAFCCCCVRAVCLYTLHVVCGYGSTAVPFAKPTSLLFGCMYVYVCENACFLLLCT
jgi:hypothetical protein